MGARPTTRVQEIVDRIADAIERGLLKPGEKLASVRRAAEDHGCLL